MKSTFYIFLFIIIVLSIFLDTRIVTLYQYFVFGFFAALFLIGSLSAGVKIRKGINLYPAMMFFLWIYGVVVGLLNENKTSFVLSNFAGLSLYATYYIMPRNIDPGKIFKVILFGVIIAQIVAWLNFDPNNLRKLASDVSFSTARSYIDGTLILSLGLISVYLYFVRNLSYLGFSIVTLIVPIMSKGFLLAFISLVFSIFILKKNKSLIIFLAGACFLILLLTSQDFIYSIYSGYAFEFSEQSIRFEQITGLTREFNFWGNGLGALVPENLLRRGSYQDSYSAEITYLNLIHKLGAASLILFCFYGHTLYIIFKNISRNNNLYVNVFCLGLMMYLVVGLGNPMLISPLFILIHMVVLMMISSSKRNIDL